MAERRMFAKTIIDSDAFLEMPQSSQNLYFHFAMRADDDGFINNPKSIMRLIGCKDDDANILIAKKFLIPFESGVVVIKHWKIHNYIRNDRYNETKYVEEKSQLEYDENNAYRLTKGIPLVDERLTQVRLGKVRLSEDKLVEVNSAPSANEEIIESIPLNDSSLFGVTKSMYEEWATLYPAVDVRQQLRSMVGWCNANPTKRKTKAGIKKFINGWLSREQDRGKVKPLVKDTGLDKDYSEPEDPRLTAWVKKERERLAGHH